MSKTVELARHLSTLNINNMYKTDFYWTWDKTDDEIDAIFTVADALRDLRERNKSTRVFDSGLGISIFRDNSTRTLKIDYIQKSRFHELRLDNGRLYNHQRLAGKNHRSLFQCVNIARKTEIFEISEKILVKVLC